MSLSFCSSDLGDEDRGPGEVPRDSDTKRPARVTARRVNTPDPSFADCPAHTSPLGSLFNADSASVGLGGARESAFLTCSGRGGWSTLGRARSLQDWLSQPWHWWRSGLENSVEEAVVGT